MWRAARWPLSGPTVIVVWTVYGCVVALQQDLAATLRSQPTPFWVGFVAQLPQAWLWCGLTPAILWLCRRFPLRGPAWLAHVILHLGASWLMVFTLHLVLAAYLPSIPITGQAAGPILTRAVRGFGLAGVTDSLLYWVVLAIEHVRQEAARNATRVLRESQLEGQLAHSRLAVLTARLQPHFLFNALNSISALVADDPDSANDMIARLSSLLRRALTHTKSPLIRLEQELELLEDYLALQELRFGDRLRVAVWVVGDVGSVLVPALLLQPIMENAIHHTMEGGDGSARVEVTIQEDGERCRLEVADSGPGFTSLDGVFARGEGLENTRARLQEAYGDQQRLSLTNRFRGGASVVIELPLLGRSH